MNGIQGRPAELTNWTGSARSACVVVPVVDEDGIRRAMEAARARGLSVIAHGAGHSYTDAALNTAGVVLDMTGMRRILAWDPETGVMVVEPGVTLRSLAQRAAQAGWWPAVAPSTSEATVGGCAAMNVNGRNAWKCGPFGAHILALEVVFPNGEARRVAGAGDSELLRALVGSLGLLGVITSITVQLQRCPSPFVRVRRRAAASLREVLALFAEEAPGSDYMEAWLDGFASGARLGRGVLTSASLCAAGEAGPAQANSSGLPNQLARPLIRGAAALARPALRASTRLANGAHFWQVSHAGQTSQPEALFPFTFWPEAVFAGHQALFPHGFETFQAFVPSARASETFEQLVRASQQQDCWPLWCIVKQHRRDPFLLSYQVDGFSLELTYPRARPAARFLEPLLQRMLAEVVEAGGRFYLAKDRWLTAAQYRHSAGQQAVEAFLQLKHQFDPDTLLQSDLYRRVFQPAAG